MKNNSGWYKVDEERSTYFYTSGSISFEGVVLLRREVDEGVIYDTVYFKDGTSFLVEPSWKGVTQEHDSWIPSRTFVAELGSVSAADLLSQVQSPPTAVQNAVASTN